MKLIELLHPEQRLPSKAYLVNELRKAVFTWREQGYPHTTDTTRRLIKFWFSEDHIVDGEPFEFWFCQREAIEAIIYVYEVKKKRNFTLINWDDKKFLYRIVNQEYKIMNELSPGQKATALLLLLFAQEDRIVILDQPEENFDNRFIYEDVVKILREMKGKRQLFIATHNANIPAIRRL